MKKLLFYLGLGLSIIGAFSFLKYVIDYNSLSDYGRGYVWGKVLIIIIGIVLILLSRKIKPKL